jgi:uncharacterized protein
MRVFVTGGTGLIGGRLIERLLARGDKPVVLSRRPEVVRDRWQQRCDVVAGDPVQAGEWMQAIHGADAVVHLAGENIFGHRWTTAFKGQLRASRLQGTANIVRVLSEQPRRADGSAKVLVSGSAIGYYGPCGDQLLDENAPAGDDFLARLCVEWEQATQLAADAGVRVACVRTGIVLDRDGGALKQMLLPFRLCMGGRVGSGRQYMSWIHNDDVSGLILLALDHAQAQGPINTTAPQPVTNHEFARELGHVIHRPSFIPTPGFALRVMLGESAYVITTGQRVVPRRAQELGYTFRFPELQGALRDLLGNSSSEAPASSEPPA